MSAAPTSSGLEGLAQPRKWTERWAGSGSDKGWSIWECDHGDRIAYVGECSHSEWLTSVIVTAHNAALATRLAAPVQPQAPSGLSAKQLWLGILSEAGCVSQSGQTYILLTEEMRARLSVALGVEDGASPPPSAESLQEPIGFVAASPTDSQIMKIAGQWFVTGENQLRHDGYYYRSLGTPTNVRGSDLVTFARAVLWDKSRRDSTSALAAPVAVPQAPRMLSQPEVQEVYRSEYGQNAMADGFRLVEAVQRKYEAVNAGLTIPASKEPT